MADSARGYSKQDERRRHRANKQVKDRAARRELLLREIQELGGDAADLELVDGIDSDEEPGGGGGAAAESPDTKRANKAAAAKADNDKGLAKELKKFAKGLFGGKANYLDEITVDDDDTGDDADDGRDDDDEEQVPELVAAPEPATTKNKSREPAKKVATTNTDDDDFKIHPSKASRASIPTNNGLLLAPRAAWWEAEVDEIAAPTTETPDFVVEKQHRRAKELLETENERHRATMANRQFISTIMQSGTLSDRISALTLVVTESPLHAVKTLDSLLGMCRKKSRNEAVSSVSAMKDLFQGTLLPDRKLIYFKDRPVGKGATDQHLLLWAFEDYLKRSYFDFLGIMEQLSLDSLSFPRNHMVRYFYDLMKDKPEQEANLLRLLVNKLGDRDSKIASKCSHFCLQLQLAHPAMKHIVVKEIENVLFRPAISESAQYYAIVTLNQTILSRREAEVANRLVTTYFTFFQKLSKQMRPDDAEDDAAPATDKKGGRKNRKAVKRENEAKQEQTTQEAQLSKMLSAVLTGINRAYPFSELGKGVVEKQLDVLYRISHDSNLSTAVQALLLLQQVAVAEPATAARFYRALYESVFDPRLIVSSKQALYLNLLVKAVKNDTDDKRVLAFAKRLVQSLSLHSPSFICAAIYLLAEIETTRPDVRSLLSDADASESAVDVDGDDDGVAKVEIADSAEVKTTRYDARARDPRFANADQSRLYELLPLAGHYHPTVVLFATALLQGKPMPAKPDLSLHTLAHFLDRFVYRNAKTKASDRGGSLMQPLANGGAGGPADALLNRDMVFNLHAAAARRPVNTDAFLNQRRENVLPDERFFYTYFKDRAAQQQQAAAAGGRSTAGNATAAGKKGKQSLPGEEDELDEEDVWQALVNSRPDVEAGGGGGEADSDESDGELGALQDAMSDDADSDAGSDSDDDHDDSDRDDDDDDDDDTAEEAEAAGAVLDGDSESDAESDEIDVELHEDVDFPFGADDSADESAGDLSDADAGDALETASESADSPSAGADGQEDEAASVDGTDSAAESSDGDNSDVDAELQEDSDFDFGEDDDDLVSDGELADRLAAAAAAAAATTSRSKGSAKRALAGADIDGAAADAATTTTTPARKRTKVAEGGGPRVQAQAHAHAHAHAQDKAAGKEARRKLRAMSAFASADDYADLLGD